MLLAVLSCFFPSCCFTLLVLWLLCPSFVVCFFAFVPFPLLLPLFSYPTTPGLSVCPHHHTRMHACLIFARFTLLHPPILPHSDLINFIHYFRIQFDCCVGVALTDRCIYLPDECNTTERQADRVQQRLGRKRTKATNFFRTSTQITIRSAFIRDMQ